MQLAFGFIYLRDYFMTYVSAISLISSAIGAYAPTYDPNIPNDDPLAQYDNVNFRRGCIELVQPSFTNGDAVLSPAGMTAFVGYLGVMSTLLVADIVLVAYAIFSTSHVGIHDVIIALEQLKVARPLRWCGRSGNSLSQFLYKASTTFRVWGIAIFTVIALIVIVVPAFNSFGFTNAGLEHFVFNAVLAAYTIGGLRGNEDLFGTSVPLEKQVRCCAHSLIVLLLANKRNAELRVIMVARLFVSEPDF